MIKKAIAVMTSGGDSPGMNAAARAVVRMSLVAKYRITYIVKMRDLRFVKTQGIL